MDRSVNNLRVHRQVKIIKIYNQKKFQQFILQNHRKFSTAWIGVSANPNVTWDFIINHPDYLWSLWSINGNPNVTLKEMSNNPIGKQFNLSEFSINHNVTLKDVAQNPDFPWDYNLLCENPNITLEQ